MARRLGAGRYGQLLAGLGVAVAPFTLIIFSFYSVNALEVLFWTVTWFLMVELIRTRDPRLWLAVGLVAGLALLNKHTFVLLLFGLAVGVLATPLRTCLRSRWLWLGVAVAVLLASPNLYWNLEHGWPSLAFYRSRAGMNIPTSLVESLILQIVGTNPASVLVWLPGLVFLLFSRAARSYRPLGAAFLTLLVAMLFSDLRRGDRIAGAYPLVLAAGAAFWDQWRGRWSTGIRWTLPALLLVVGLLVLPVALPISPPQRIADFFEFIGESPELEQADIGHALPIYLLARLEWERFAEDVIRAWESLPLEDRERSVVLAPHWLYASVVEYYGRDRGLPPVVSPHNAYYFWRQDAVGRDVVLSVLVEPEVLALHFAETRRLGIFRCEHCASWRPDIPIHVSYGPAKSLEDLLADWRYFGLEPSPQLRP